MPSRSRVKRVLGAIAIDVPRAHRQMGHMRPFGLRAATGPRSARPDRRRPPPAPARRTTRATPPRSPRATGPACSQPPRTPRRHPARADPAAAPPVPRPNQVHVAAAGPELRDFIVEDVRTMCRQTGNDDDEPVAESELRARGRHRIGAAIDAPLDRLWPSTKRRRAARGDVVTTEALRTSASARAQPTGPGDERGELQGDVRPRLRPCEAPIARPRRHSTGRAGRATDCPGRGRPATRAPVMAPADVPTTRMNAYIGAALAADPPAARPATPDTTCRSRSRTTAQLSAPSSARSRPPGRRRTASRRSACCGGQPERQVDVEVGAPIVGVAGGQTGERQRQPLTMRTTTSISMTAVSQATKVKRSRQAIRGIARMIATRNAQTTVWATLIARSIDAGGSGMDPLSGRLDRQPPRTPVAPRPDVVARRRAPPAAPRNRARSTAGRSGQEVTAVAPGAAPAARNSATSSSRLLKTCCRGSTKTSCQVRSLAPGTRPASYSLALRASSTSRLRRAPARARRRRWREDAGAARA